MVQSMFAPQGQTNPYVTNYANPQQMGGMQPQVMPQQGQWGGFGGMEGLGHAGPMQGGGFGQWGGGDMATKGWGDGMGGFGGFGQDPRMTMNPGQQFGFGQWGGRPDFGGRR